MDNLNKEELTKFVDSIDGFDKEKNPRKIIIFGYFLTHIINEVYFDQKMIRDCYDLLDDRPPSNISDFFNKLKKSDKIIPKNPGYRLHRNTVHDLELLIKINDDEMKPTNQSSKQMTKILIKDLQKPLEKPLTVTKNYDESYFDKTKANETLSVIEKLDTLQLPKFRIIGSYVRFDGKVINHLKNLKQKIIEGITLFPNSTLHVHSQNKSNS